MKFQSGKATLFYFVLCVVVIAPLTYRVHLLTKVLRQQLVYLEIRAEEKITKKMYVAYFMIKQFPDLVREKEKLVQRVEKHFNNNFSRISCSEVIQTIASQDRE